MDKDFTLADDLDCCPTIGDDVKVRVVPEVLCQRIVQALRAQPPQQ